MSLNKKVMLSDVKGCFCTTPSFYTKVTNINLKEDIKNNGLQENISVLDFKKENLFYRYYVADGNHRLRILKDLVIEKNKNLTEESITVIISKNKQDYKKILKHVLNGDLKYNECEKI